MTYNTKLFIKLTDKIDELLILCKEDGFNGMHYWNREVDQYFDHGKKEAMSPQVFCQAFGEYLYEMFIEHELDVISGGCIYMNELLVIIANEGVHWRKIASKFLPYAAEKEYVFDYKPHANYVAW